MSVTLIQRGCRDGHPKGGTEPPAGPSRFLHIQADVRYCLSDQCNAKGLDLGSPGQATGKLAVPIFMWSCQAPSCAVPPSRHFGPLQLRQAGTCCSGSYCNGQGARALLSLGLKISSGHVPTGIPGYGPLANATAWKGHQQPGRSHGTAATELPHQDGGPLSGPRPHRLRPQHGPTQPQLRGGPAPQHRPPRAPHRAR
ncbi:uncharacterized protein [Lepidochelys kempii]|uniref:uncharacterized protein isoform X2 n=1 Tax=Lepidochelys kempii TaxID=8472 RepID=UPI003C6FF916